MLASDGVGTIARRRDDGVLHKHVDLASAFMQDIDTAARLRFDGSRRSPEADVADSGGRQIAIDAVGFRGHLAPRGGDVEQLSVDVDVARTFMMSIDTIGFLARRIDGAGYDFITIGDPVENVDVDVPGALVMGMNAGGVIFRRIDVDAFSVDDDGIAGSGGFRTFDPLSGCGRVAAYGGLLRLRLRHGERHHDGQGDYRNEGSAACGERPGTTFGLVCMVDTMIS